MRRELPYVKCIAPSGSGLRPALESFSHAFHTMLLYSSVIPDLIECVPIRKINFSYDLIRELTV